MEGPRPALVSTIGERCRVCYTCVRDCPAKAIRISGGQAEVLPDRCIGCGNCVRVCSQKAKQVLSSSEDVERLLGSGDRVAACLAPSFPAQFPDVDYQRVVGMVRDLGFDLVLEVGFGADLVAQRYAQLLAEHPDRRFIAANCPAIVEYIIMYHPNLVPHLAPIASPMLALARAARALYNDDLRIVFVGPCIAKKRERDPGRPDPEIDAVLTFDELAHLLSERGTTPATAAPSDFDPPAANAGALFPISRGMLQAAAISEDLMTGDVVTADGKSNFVEAVREFESGDLKARLLEMLCCPGCIMGPGISNDLPLFRRRSLVSRFARLRARVIDQNQWRRDLELLHDLDLSRRFEAREQTTDAPSEADLSIILTRIGKSSPGDELNCGACGYNTCREHAAAIHQGLAESEMCLPHTIEQLKSTLQELARSHEQLAGVQAALIQSEKLASMGQLAAAIAHEVNNPLGVVLMYAHLLLDERAGDDALAGDLRMIAEQTDRCRKIVAGLLNFARQNKVFRQAVDLSELVDKALTALPPPAGVTVAVEHETRPAPAELDPDQITQVIVNLVSNAYEAMAGQGRLTVSTGRDNGLVRFAIADTGPGIAPENLPKLFEPFFTTKQLGKGTGLGLAVSYGIVKMHHGEVRVQSNSDPRIGPTGACFTVLLPVAEDG